MESITMTGYAAVTAVRLRTLAPTGISFQGRSVSTAGHVERRTATPKQLGTDLPRRTP